MELLPAVLAVGTRIAARTVNNSSSVSPKTKRRVHKLSKTVGIANMLAGGIGGSDFDFGGDGFGDGDFGGDDLGGVEVDAGLEGANGGEGGLAQEEYAGGGGCLNCGDSACAGECAQGRCQSCGGPSCGGECIDACVACGEPTCTGGCTLGDGEGCINCGVPTCTGECGCQNCGDPACTGECPSCAYCGGDSCMGGCTQETCLDCGEPSCTGQCIPAEDCGDYPCNDVLCQQVCQTCGDPTCDGSQCHPVCGKCSDPTCYDGCQSNQICQNCSSPSCDGQECRSQQQTTALERGGMGPRGLARRRPGVRGVTRGRVATSQVSGTNTLPTSFSSNLSGFTGGRVGARGRGTIGFRGAGLGRGAIRGLGRLTTSVPPSVSSGFHAMLRARGTAAIGRRTGKPTHSAATRGAGCGTTSGLGSGSSSIGGGANCLQAIHRGGSSPGSGIMAGGGWGAMRGQPIMAPDRGRGIGRSQGLIRGVHANGKVGRGRGFGRGTSSNHDENPTNPASSADPHTHLIPGLNGQVEVVRYPAIVTPILSSSNSNPVLHAPVPHSVYSFQPNTAFASPQPAVLPSTLTSPADLSGSQPQRKLQLDEYSRYQREKRHIYQLALLQQEEQLRVQQLNEELERERLEEYKKRSGNEKEVLQKSKGRAKPPAEEINLSLKTAHETVDIERTPGNLRHAKLMDVPGPGERPTSNMSTLRDAQAPTQTQTNSIPPCVQSPPSETVDNRNRESQIFELPSQPETQEQPSPKVPMTPQSISELPTQASVVNQPIFQLPLTAAESPPDRSENRLSPGTGHNRPELPGHEVTLLISVTGRLDDQYPPPPYSEHGQAPPFTGYSLANVSRYRRDFLDILNNETIPESRPLPEKSPVQVNTTPVIRRQQVQREQPQQLRYQQIDFEPAQLETHSPQPLIPTQNQPQAQHPHSPNNHTRLGGGNAVPGPMNHTMPHGQLQNVAFPDPRACIPPAATPGPNYQVSFPDSGGSFPYPEQRKFRDTAQQTPSKVPMPIVTPQFTSPPRVPITSNPPANKQHQHTHTGPIWHVQSQTTRLQQRLQMSLVSEDMSYDQGRQHVVSELAAEEQTQKAAPMQPRNENQAALRRTTAPAAVPNRPEQLERDANGEEKIVMSATIQNFYDPFQWDMGPVRR